MLRLLTDKRQIESLLFSPCPQTSVGIRMKMRALYRAYGVDHDFCSYYGSKDGTAAAVLYQGSLFFSDSLCRTLIWEDSLAVLPVSFISSDTPLDMDGYAETCGTFFKKDNVSPSEGTDMLAFGNIEAAYCILKEVFPDVFAQGSASEQRDLYMRWYCEMSHRMRRGITQTAVLEELATATVYCIEEDAVFLSQIGVLPSARGSGSGRRMLEAVMRKYAGKTCYVFSKNSNADKFYTALTFTPIGVWRDYNRITSERINEDT